MKNKHFLADKFPLIVAAVLMLAVSMLPSMALSLVIEPFYNESNGLMLQMIWCIGQIIVTILLMVLFEKWFVPAVFPMIGSTRDDRERFNRVFLMDIFCRVCYTVFLL